MEKSEILELIKAEVDKQVAEQVSLAKKELAKIIRNKLDGTGQYAGANKIMTAVEEWAKEPFDADSFYKYRGW